MLFGNLSVHSTNQIVRVRPTKEKALVKKQMKQCWIILLVDKITVLTPKDIIYKIIKNFRFLKTCLSRYDVMTL